MAKTVRVVKLGGSLLEMSGLEDRLEDWLSQQTSAHYVLVVGGGMLVEEVRSWDQRWEIDQDAAHWLCIDLMSATARLLSSRMPGLLLTDDHSLLERRIEKPGRTVFDPSRWLRETEPQLRGTTLPIGWDVTSDSIAARLAVTLNADEFVLLKSTLPEEAAQQGIAALAECGTVDAMLPRLMPEMPPVRMVNLRSDPPREVSIQASAPPPQAV